VHYKDGKREKYETKDEEIGNIPQQPGTYNPKTEGSGEIDKVSKGKKYRKFLRPKW